MWVQIFFFCWRKKFSWSEKKLSVGVFLLVEMFFCWLEKKVLSVGENFVGWKFVGKITCWVAKKLFVGKKNC